MTVGRVTPTTPVGGGRPWWLGALVVLAALVTVVWIGVSGRPVSTAQPVADIPSASAPTLAPDATAPPTASSPEPTPAQSAIARAGESFGVTAAIGSQQYTSLLDELEPGYLFAIFRVDNPGRQDPATLSLKEFFTEALDGPVALGEWPLPLDPLYHGSRERQTVIDIHVPARPKLLNVPTPVLRGYRLTVYAQNELLFGTVAVEIRIGPNQSITGDDGSLGGTPRSGSSLLAYGRGPGLYNRCRLSAPPPTHSDAAPPRDEAGC